MAGQRVQLSAFFSHSAQTIEQGEHTLPFINEPNAQAVHSVAEFSQSVQLTEHGKQLLLVKYLPT